MSCINALLFGLNYTDHKNQLYGCINDVKLVKKFLLNKGVKNITVCTDNTKIKPTRENMLKLINRQVDILNNDYTKTTLWIHYSGHGYYKLDENDDENKENDRIEGDGDLGFDETLCCLDHQQITDDELNKIFSKINPNKKLICVFDCCHSGTALDLPYSYKYLSDKSVLDKNISKTISANVILLSACKDIQQATDSYNIIKNYKYTGAFTASIIKHLYKKNIYLDLLLTQSNIFLKQNTQDQTPQLSSSKRLNKYSLLLNTPLQNELLKKVYFYDIKIKQFTKKTNGNDIYSKYIFFYNKNRNDILKFLNRC